jgi:hypothetical protein
VPVEQARPAFAHGGVERFVCRIGLWGYDQRNREPRGAALLGSHFADH